MTKVDYHQYRDYEALNSKHSVDYVIKQYDSSTSAQHVDVSGYSQVLISCNKITRIKFDTEVETSASNLQQNDDGVFTIGVTSNPEDNGQDIYVLTVPNMIDDVSSDTIILNFIFTSTGDKMFIWLM